MLFIAYLLGVAFARALATIPVAVTSNQPACPGEPVAVQCTVGGDVLTWNIPDGAFNLLRGRHEEGDVMSFHWTLLELDENTLQSTLTFAATTEFNIGCSNDTESLPDSVQLQVEGIPGAPDRPLTALDRMQRINKTFSSVSVFWNNPDTNNNYISRYVVSVDPATFMPANGVIEAINPQFQARKITLVLMHEQRYSIRVRADNCNNTQLGMNSSALTINIQVPPPINSCVSLPVYDYFSNRLTGIEIMWKAAPDSLEQITAGITANVQSYNISIVPIAVAAPSINITIHNDISSCGAECMYIFQNTTEMTALYYSVFVTAKNILIDGYGESTICSNQTISARNDLLGVKIQQKDYDVEVYCRPLTRFEGEAQCEVIYYSMDLYATSYFDTSGSVGNAGDFILVQLSQSFEPNTTFHLEIQTVGGRLNAKVLGTFKTERNDSHCLVSRTGRSISHGVVCYTGTTPGSTAYTLCDEGYNFNDEKMRKPTECLENGQWNGTQPQCTRHNTSSTGKEFETENTSNDINVPETCSTSLGALGAVTFLVSFPTGIVVGIIVTRFLRCNSKQKATTAESSNPVYDYISRQETQISTESNQCYMTKGAPKLPKPRATVTTVMP